MELKDLTLKEWRGIFAAIILILGFVTIIVCASMGKDVIAIVMPSLIVLMTLVTEWYFKGKEEKK